MVVRELRRVKIEREMSREVSEADKGEVTREVSRGDEIDRQTLRYSNIQQHQHERTLDSLTHLLLLLVLVLELEDLLRDICTVGGEDSARSLMRGSTIEEVTVLTV